MSESVSEKVDRFCLYNRTMIAAAFAKRNRRYQGLPAKLILCSIFDSLSIAAFPNENGVGKRYRQTLSDHTNWTDQSRVSLLNLIWVFDRMHTVPADFAQMKTWVEAEVSTRFPTSSRMISSHVNLNQDPELDVVLIHWPLSQNGKPEKLEGLRPQDFTHRNLFWKYRNRLAHEFRLPGAGAESTFRFEDQPYYQEVSTVTDINPVSRLVFDNRWELVYPTGFFVVTVKQALDSLCVKYKSEGTSPFMQYYEGSSWL